MATSFKTWLERLAASLLICTPLAASAQVAAGPGTWSANQTWAADTVNGVASSFRNPASPAGVAKSANVLRLKLVRHMTNDDEGSGFGTAAYHAPTTPRA